MEVFAMILQTIKDNGVLATMLFLVYKEKVISIQERTKPLRFFSAIYGKLAKLHIGILKHYCQELDCRTNFTNNVYVCVHACVYTYVQELILVSHQQKPR